MAESSKRSLLPERFRRVIEDFTPSENTKKPNISFESIPIVSLEESVNSLISFVPDIKEMVKKVKEKCVKPKDGLTTDESGSIMLYSLEWTPREQSFYVILNSILRLEDEQKLKPWELYLKLFIISLEKLPTLSQTIYRGIKRNLTDQYPQGKIFVWWAFSSCTTSIQVLQAEQFLGKTGTRTLFNIDSNSGKDIKNHSFFPTEDEVLLIAARKFQVISSLDSGNDLSIIQIKEIESDYPLLGSPIRHIKTNPFHLKSSEDSSQSQSQSQSQKSSSSSSNTSIFPPPPIPGKPPRFPF